MDYVKSLRYLHRVLDFHEYIQFSEENDKQKLEIYESYIAKGELNQNYGYNKLANRDEIREGTPVSIAIIPKWFEGVLIDPREDSGCIHETFIPISPFYITTKIDANNKLDLESANVVWATSIETPQETDGVSFKTNEIGPVNKNNWSSFWESVVLRFEQHYEISWNANVIKDTKGKEHQIKTISKDGSPCFRIMRNDVVTGAVNAIARLLVHLTSHSEEINPLIKKMLGGDVQSINCMPQLGTCVSAHRGQMKNEYPLADAQRHAVHCMAQLEEGNVLAVSGPPGTGKTTMLQSVVADLIVKHALNGENPPLILATSSNNKAITNIIDAFKIEDEGKVADSLYTRWLKYKTANLNSPLPLAAYLPSSHTQNRGNFFCTDECGGDGYTTLRAAFDNNKKQFLEMARKSEIITGDDIETVKQQLTSELKNTYAMLVIIERSLNQLRKECKGNSIVQKLLAYLKNGCKKYLSEKEIEDCLMNQVKKFNFSYQCMDNNEKRKFDKNLKRDINTPLDVYADKMLDRSLRFKCFWLAVHYYEACWLLKVEKEPDLDLSKQNRNVIYEEISFVCPCLVATFYRAPRCFSKNRKAGEGGRGYLFNHIDLLIVDEAGMACTEIGIPTFSLSKRAIVVGDEKQIPPIYSIKPETSRRYWCAESNELDESYKLIDSSSSSVMKVATQKSKFNRVWDDGEVYNGLFLEEHRRCYREIINYCNELIYKGKLILRTIEAKPGELIFPVMAHFRVPHTSSEHPPTGSRRSIEEAQAIAKWIKDNEIAIVKENNGKLPKDVISVITPFTLQAKLIRTELEKIGYKDDKSIPVGTVHTFQGAESPIVIYSTVYGSEERYSFIENNRNLMNVAVSRAKKHFFLFSSKCYDENNAEARSPVGLLLHKTKEKLANQYV